MKAILLDWDGVLCDSRSLYYDLYIEAARLWNKKLPIASMAEFLEWYNPRWEENYYEMGFSVKEFEEVQVWADQWLDYAKAPLFPGIADNLRRWSQVAPLAIVSTTHSQLIRQRMRQELHLQTVVLGHQGQGQPDSGPAPHPPVVAVRGEPTGSPEQALLAKAQEAGLDSYFKHFTGGEDGSSAKREKVARTLQILEASGGVMVGDTPLDVDAGQFNGLKTVGVTYGWVSPARVRQAGPDILVDRPEDLYQAVLDSLK
ncbi:HAD family hydrolase [bacterium]|nr:HAD family hydrolase [bacterium]